MIILVSGSREYSDYNQVQKVLEDNFSEACFDEDIPVLYHGGARGVDTWAGDLANQWGIDTEIRYADWDKYGYAAGCIRNGEMLDAAIAHALQKNTTLTVLIFWDGESRGTKDMIHHCIERKQSFKVYFPSHMKLHILNRRNMRPDNISTCDIMLVDRRTVWGNPFVMRSTSDRDWETYLK